MILIIIIIIIKIIIIINKCFNRIKMLRFTKPLFFHIFIVVHVYGIFAVSEIQKS